MIEALAQWVWNGFEQVDDKDERNWVLDRLELACVADDNGKAGSALYWIDSAARVVFGESSTEYKRFAEFAGL